MAWLKHMQNEDKLNINFGRKRSRMSEEEMERII
jgi:hypothetical protein